MVPVDPAITDDLTFLRNVAAVVVDEVSEKTIGAVTVDTKRIYIWVDTPMVAPQAWQWLRCTRTWLPPFVVMLQH